MAYRKGYRFHNNHYNTPGVYSFVESRMKDYKEDGAKNIAFIGESRGGIPHELMLIDDPEQAKELLKGGDLLTACLKAYDPVADTKIGVELGGADLIFAIRSNAAKKAQSVVNQNKEVEATVGEVVSSTHKLTTGVITIDGQYTGEENKTFKITVEADGTQDMHDCFVYVEVLGENQEPVKIDPSIDQKEQLPLGDGLTFHMSVGKYTNGDTFYIPCTAKVTELEYVFTMESADYGEDCNLITHALEEGTEPGTKALTVKNNLTDEVEFFDNIGATFSIQYTGAENYAAISITPDGKGNAIKLQTFIGDNEETAIKDLDIDLNPVEIRSIKQLANTIRYYENYEVRESKLISPDLSVEDLDFATKENIKEEYQLTAVLRDLQKTTKYQSKHVEVTLINREVSNYNDYDERSLIGGSEGLPVTSYEKFLDLISEYDIDYVVPLTDDMHIIAECREHVIEMSEKMGKERRLVCGAGNGLSARQAINNAKRLSHPRVQYVGTGFYDLDKFGNAHLYPAYILAAQHAGRAAFLGVESATADVYNMLEPERTFEGSERTDVINNGVLFFNKVNYHVNNKKFYAKLNQDYTTFTDENDPLYVERSTGAIADQLSKEVRRELDKMLTGKLTPTGTLESARNKIISILQDYEKRGIILGYGVVNVKKVRDKTHIEFEVAPTQVNNYTFIDLVFTNQDIILD